MINQENWTYSYYSQGERRAQLDIIGSPSEQDFNKIEYLYGLSIYQEGTLAPLEQQFFNTLEQSIATMQSLFGGVDSPWQFISKEGSGIKSKKKRGCGKCCGRR